MANPLIFSENNPEVIYLSKKDWRLKELIHEIGPIILTLHRDYFSSLVRSIISQQLSSTASRNIWERFLEQIITINPTSVMAIPDDQLRTIGISRSKATYIKNLSYSICEGKLDFSLFKLLPDKEIIEILCKFKGIGQWTAEMFLIFSLGRMDIISIHDAGLCRAMKWLYNIPCSLNSDTILGISEKWKPYRTLASLYLWKSIDTGMITNTFKAYKQ